METGYSMTSNLISVIVPVYNGEAYLDRCIQSILDQTYTEWELLLIDGASLDATPELCDAWQKKDDRIRAFHTEENRGVSSGRNTGMGHARGAYLMFVDADDWLLPDCLRMLHEELQESGAQIACCDFVSCTDQDWEALREKTKAGRIASRKWTRGQQTERELSQKKIDGQQTETVRKENGRQPAGRKLLAGTDFLREGILERDTHCWGKLYRREAVEGFHFREDFTIGEDMLFLWDLTQGTTTLSSCSAAGYCYYHNPNGAMLKPFRDSDMDQIRCWQLLLEQLTGKPEQTKNPVTNREPEREKDPVTDREPEQTENPVTAGEPEQAQNPAAACKYDSDVITKTAAILLISCMLTAGKIALLPAEKRTEYHHHTIHCRKVLRETLQIAGAYEGLDRGYRLKVRFFEKAPNLYLCLYHSLRKRKENMK